MNNLLSIHQCYTPPLLPLSPTSFSISPVIPSLYRNSLSLPHKDALSSSVSRSKANFRVFPVSNFLRIWDNREEEETSAEVARELEVLAPDGAVYRDTLRLVECAMFASVAGLAYLLSSSLAIENYFGCFFSLPIVISSMRWGVAAGRKTMVATSVLLIVLSGPVKALTYLLMHGLLGFAMGSLWRMQVNWWSSVSLCTLVRALGALGNVLISSFFLRENILALITVNVHASLTFALNSLGFNTVPSMNAIYAIFGALLLLNCATFVFLLHIIYALFFTRLGMKESLLLPQWLDKAL